MNTEPVLTGELLDRENLEQCLIDFEIANARVVDLTNRLTELNRRFVEASTALHKAEIALRKNQQELRRVKSIKGSIKNVARSGATRVLGKVGR